MGVTPDKKAERSLDELETVKGNEKALERSESKSLRVLNRFSAWLYRLFITGLFGSIFTLYGKVQRAFAGGLISSAVSDGTKLSSWLAKLRFLIARSIEQSRILCFIRKKLASLMSVNLSVYGLFLMIFGGLSAVFGIVDNGLSAADILESPDVIIGAVLVISSFSLMTSSKTLATAIRQGRILGKIMIDLFGISEESFDVDRTSGKEAVSVAILLGVIAGALTYFVSPAVIIALSLILIAGYLILRYPEIGILFSFAFTPVSLLFEIGQSATVAIVAATLVSYFIKVLCGRRRMKVEFLGVLLLVFAGIVAFGGAFSAGGAASGREAGVMFCFALSYVAIVNLLRSRVWLRRCIFALSGVLILLSVLTVVELLTVRLGMLPSFFGPNTLAASAIGRLFADRDAVSAYMIILFPMLVYKILKSERLINRFAMFIALAASVFAVVYLGSRPAWLGLLVGCLLFMILYSHKTLTAILIAALPTACAFMFVPAELKSRIFNYFSFSQVSVSNRIDIWEGGLRMIRKYLFGGIGIGKTAFREVYPIYANAGFEGADSLYNVFLQILAALGVVGLSVFVIMMFVYLQKSLCFMRYNTDRSARLPSLVCLCSMVSALSMGIAYDVFANPGVFLVFIMIMGLGCAYVRIGDDDRDRSRSVMDPHEKSADIIIDIKY